MNKISIYIFIVIVFLGISTGFSPSQKKVKYISSDKSFSTLFSGAPLSVILVDSFKTGFIIKTCYQKYWVINGVKGRKVEIVRTSASFWEKYQKFLGMSIFRRRTKDSKESTLPLPPGMLFVNDSSYGYYKLHGSGEKYWHFHNSYKNFPKMFAWGDFVPSQSSYEEVKAHLEFNKPYFGPRNEFGINGRVTQQQIGTLKKQIPSKLVLFKKYIKGQLTLPWIKKTPLFNDYKRNKK